MERAIIMIGAALAIALPAMVAALAQGIATGKAVESIARQPEARGSINQVLIVGLAFMESLALYSLLIAIILIFTK